MISDRQLVLAAAATYDPKNKPAIASFDGAVRIFTSEVDGLLVIAIEGTHNRLGWFLDFLALTIWRRSKSHHPSLGRIHAGFELASANVIGRLPNLIGKRPYAICGHSLGAALALLLGALLKLAGKPPVKIGAFAPPRVGESQFLEVVTSIPFCAYRFGNDPVPCVPFTLWDFPYRQVPLTPIGKPRLWPFGCHHIDNYVEGIQI